MRNFSLLIFVCFLCSCENETNKAEVSFENKKDFETTMILSHKDFLKKEKEKIRVFKDSLGLQFISTGTGLQYHIYKSSEGDGLKTGELAVLSYDLTSITGDSLYKSPEGKLQEFVVDYDNVESGLHEGIKKLKVGERAYLILPAHLAHGISGDNAAISSQTTLVYNVHLVAKR
ncbi:MAG: FKBP-type peptidyl-prolyl cis-trans isomerase [Vicingaceae bacterium]|jgi:FKBP-type peptidyl-prolyl cis-trans isomerase FkpA